MRIIDFFEVVMSLGSGERERLVCLLRDAIGSAADMLDEGSFESFAVALYASMEGGLSLPKSSVIAYGAGNIAKEFLPQVLRHVEVTEIWDAFSNARCMYGVPIVKPRMDADDSDSDVVIFIEDGAIRRDVASSFESSGFERVYSYRDYISILEAVSRFPRIGGLASDKTRQVLYDFIARYEVLDSKHPQACYSVVPKKLESVQLDLVNTRSKAQGLSKRLFELLTISGEDGAEIDCAVHDFFNIDFKSAFVFACQLEIFLRSVLSHGAKTRERPIRMRDDRPYDQFAVFTVLKETAGHICGDSQKELCVAKLLRTLSPSSVPLISLECHCLTQCGRLDDALRLSRAAVKKEPNGLLSNETFYRVAALCKEKGIPVAEPLPEYDLSGRFCWSGFTFALCHGFDSKDNSALFLPCFRTLQCAANPAGDFWSGEEWIEFRKSIVDGSFRYCQKNQCANIVGGWLPRKPQCNNSEVKRIIDGDFSAVPPLEELHLSYDFHCNMKCPSCRLEFKTNSAGRNAELDMLFEKKLRPLLNNAKHLCLSGCGEAVISPHSRRVLQSLSKEGYPGLAVELRTNVVSFSPQAWDALGNGRGVVKHVAASIDAASKELFEQLRYPAKWEAALENLAFIQSLRNAGEIDMFEFHVVVQAENIGELVDIIKMAALVDADAVTFSRLVNWRGMPEVEYQSVNPFWEDNPMHGRLLQVIDEIKSLRDAIEGGECVLTANRGKKLFINMHCLPDPSADYDVIRVGELKIR